MTAASSRTKRLAAQAAARLGVPLLTFNDLRLEHGLSAVDQTDAQDGLQRNLERTELCCVVYLIVSRKPLGFL